MTTTNPVLVILERRYAAADVAYRAAYAMRSVGASRAQRAQRDSEIRRCRPALESARVALGMARREAGRSYLGARQAAIRAGATWDEATSAGEAAERVALSGVCS